MNIRRIFGGYSPHGSGARTAKLAADAGTGNLQKTALSYGKVLEVCASCHAKFRD